MGIMLAQESLITELEEAIQSGSRDKRVETLRRVTDLFLGGADRFNEEQIGVFDDVLGCLIERIETRALTEFSERIAPIDTAPGDVIRRLAHHDEIAVAGPILGQSPRLTTSDLVEIAKTKSQGHLLAISSRSRLEEVVTDVLVDRGNQEVAHKLATNSGARFSEPGLAALTRRAGADEGLAAQLMQRLDMPLDMFRALLLRATEAVRTRLLSAVGPERQAEIRLVLAEASEKVGQQVTRDFTEAHETVGLMHRQGGLNEAALLQFATYGRYEHVVAALSALCRIPLESIDRLMRGNRIDALILPCKAAGFEWTTMRAILKVRSPDRSISEHDLMQAKNEYANLSMTTAQRVLRFWQVREKAGHASSEVPTGT